MQKGRDRWMVGGKRLLKAERGRCHATLNNVMQKLASLRWLSLMGNAGLKKLALVVLTGLLAQMGRSQGTFAAAQPISGVFGSVTNLNFAVVHDSGAPSIAGFAPNAPLWYKWIAPRDGEVQLDTLGSADGLYGQPADTVLGVYTGSSLSSLCQVAANDDLYRFWQINESSGQNV